MRLKNNYKIIIITVLLSIVSVVESSEYIPDDDYILLEVPKLNLVDSYRNKLKNSPGNIPLLIQVTKSLITKAKKDNSDLLFGQIESILMKYKSTVVKNNTLKTLYADILQHRHAFYKAKIALKDINSSQAILMRATIYQNLGEYSDASSECKKLLGKVNILVAVTCITHAKSYQSKLTENFTILKKVMNNFTGENSATKTWALTALGEMAYRMGSLDESIGYYQQANKLSPDNTHIISEWVDILFSMNKHDEIISLLKDNHEDMRLNLRYLRSLIETNRYNELLHGTEKESLKDLITITELREDQRHYDTRAEFYIWINKDSNKALNWARENWSVIKTPAAAKLLLIASKLTKNKTNLGEVKAWFEQNNIEDNSLRRMLSLLIKFEVVA